MMGSMKEVKESNELQREGMVGEDWHDGNKVNS